MAYDGNLIAIAIVSLFNGIPDFLVATTRAMSAPQDGGHRPLLTKPSHPRRCGTATVCLHIMFSTLRTDIDRPEILPSLFSSDSDSRDHTGTVPGTAVTAAVTYCGTFSEHQTWKSRKPTPRLRH